MDDQIVPRRSLFLPPLENVDFLDVSVHELYSKFFNGPVSGWRKNRIQSVNLISQLSSWCLDNSNRQPMSKGGTGKKTTLYLVLISLEFAYDALSVQETEQLKREEAEKVLSLHFILPPIFLLPIVPRLYFLSKFQKLIF